VLVFFLDNELNVEPKNSDGHTSRVFDVISNVNMSNDATALAGKSLICYDIQNQ